MKKIIREIVELAERFNFKLDNHRHGNHLKFRHGPTGRVVFTGSTPSDQKARDALRAEFKKIDEGRVPTDPSKRPRGGAR